MDGIPAFLALFGFVVATGFFLSARAAKAALRDRSREADALRAELEAAQEALGQVRAEAKARREEAQQLRSDLDRARKKAFEQQEAAKRKGGAQALREDVDKLAARLAEARAEVEQKSARAHGLERDIEKAAAELARAKEELVRAEERPPEPEHATVAAPAVDEAKLAAEAAAEKDRADRAESKLSEARKRIQEIEKDLKGARGRLETERRVFLVQKSELELAGDRYAELKRRHDALRKDHDELVEAVRQAAREERALAQAPPKKEEDQPAR